MKITRVILNDDSNKTNLTAETTVEQATAIEQVVQQKSAASTGQSQTWAAYVYEWAYYLVTPWNWWGSGAKTPEQNIPQPESKSVEAPRVANDDAKASIERVPGVEGGEPGVATPLKIEATIEKAVQQEVATSSQQSKTWSELGSEILPIIDPTPSFIKWPIQKLYNWYHDITEMLRTPKQQAQDGFKTLCPKCKNAVEPDPDCSLCRELREMVPVPMSKLKRETNKLFGFDGEEEVPPVFTPYFTSKTGTAVDVIADILPHFSLFTMLYLIGLLGMIFNYKNFLVTMMAVELMYLGVVSNFVLVSLFGWVAAATHALLLLITAASDSAVGLGLLIVLYRFNRSVSFEAYKELHSTYDLDI